MMGHLDNPEPRQLARKVSRRRRLPCTFTVVIEPADEMWHAYCSTLLVYGAGTWGTTREEALPHTREMAEMIVERLAEEQPFGRQPSLSGECRLKASNGQGRIGSPPPLASLFTNTC